MEQTPDNLLEKALRDAYDAGYKKGEEDGRRNALTIIDAARTKLAAEAPLSVLEIEIANLFPDPSTTDERIRSSLARAQINTLGELLAKSEDDLLTIVTFGQKSLDAVKMKLGEYGLELRSSRGLRSRSCARCAPGGKEAAPGRATWRKNPGILQSLK